MAQNSQLVRQSMGCGWELKHPTMPACPWTHAGYTDDAPTTCAGYTTKLPEVIEINRARLHWNKGSARDFCGGEPTENVNRGIEILEGAANEANCWRPPESK